MARGLGPVCAARARAAAGPERATQSGVVVTVDGGPLPHAVYHSPTGMEWGYGGSGPADLALSILADYLGERSDVRAYLKHGGLAGEPPLSLRLHQAFKWDFVARWPREGWRLTGAEIAQWLRQRGHAVPAYDVVYEGRRLG